MSGAAVPLATSAPYGLQIDGATIAAINSAHQLELVDAATGRRTSTVRIGPRSPAPPELQALNAGLAAYRADGFLYVVRVPDGLTVRLALKRAAAPLRARIDGSVLVVSYNELGVRRPGRVAVFALADIRSALG